MHADEHPGLLVAQHLLRHLEQLDQQNALKAEIVLVPFANPVGLRQKFFGHLVGRSDVDPELAEQDCLCILDFLAHKHLIERIPSPKKPIALKPCRVDQVRMVKATASGIITYRSKLGETLKAGEAFADLVLVDHPKAKSIPILAP